MREIEIAKSVRMPLGITSFFETMSRLSLGALCVLVLLFTGCGVFVTPPVDCEGATYEVELSWRGTARSGQSCLFGAAWMSRVHSPGIDEGRSRLPNETLVGTEVTVARYPGFVLLCDDVGPEPCDLPASEIRTLVRNDATLAYQIIVEPDEMGLGRLPAGSSNVWDDVFLLTENYGPGNSCPVYGSFEFHCDLEEQEN